MYLLLLSALACYAAARFPSGHTYDDSSFLESLSLGNAFSNGCIGSFCPLDSSASNFPTHFRPKKHFPTFDYSGLSMDDSLSSMLDSSLSLSNHFPLDFSGLSLDDSLSMKPHLPILDPSLSLDFSGFSRSMQPHFPILDPSLSLDSSALSGSMQPHFPILDPSLSTSALSGSLLSHGMDPSNKQIHWETNVGPALPPIVRYYYKPGVANGIKTYIPGQDYKIYYYDDGDLLKKQTYIAGADYDINLFREGDVYKKMTVKSGDDVDIDAFQAGDKYYDKDVFVEGTKTVKTGKGEPKYYKEKPVTIKGTGLHTGLEMPSEKELKAKAHLITDSHTNPFPASFSQSASSASLGLRHGFH